MKRLIPLLLIATILLSACGQSVVLPPLEDISEAMVSELELSTPLTLNEELLYSIYGLEGADYTEAAGFQGTEGLFPDECVLVKAVDSKAESRIVNALQQRLEQVREQSRDYDPEGYAMAKKAAVETDGLYVRLLLSSRAEMLETLWQKTINGEPLPTPALTPEPTPESAPKPTPAPVLYGKVEGSERVPDSFFDDAIFVGDSVTYIITRQVLRHRADDWPDCLGKATLFAASNYSWHKSADDNPPGEYCPSYNGKLMKVEQAVVASGAKKLFIGMGMNDICLLGLDATMENVDTTINRVRTVAPETEVYLMSMTPRLAGYDAYDLSNAYIREYNERLLAYAEEHDCHYLDCYGALANENGELPPEYCADPGTQAIHPNGAGADVWLEYIYTHTVPREGVTE